MYKVPYVEPITLCSLDTGEPMIEPGCPTCGRGGEPSKPWSMRKWAARVIIDDPAFGAPSATTARLGWELVQTLASVDDRIARGERVNSFPISAEVRSRVVAVGREPQGKGIPNTMYIQFLRFLQAFEDAKPE